MAEVVVVPNEVLNILVLLSIMGLIGIFLVKFYNILHKGQKFSVQISTVFLAVGMICFLFIEIGLFLTIPLDIETSLLEFNFYHWFSRVFIAMIWVFWFVELIFNAADSVTDSVTRMTKRREERINRY